MKQKKSIRCPYCGGTAILRDASFVYGEKSYGGKVYVCSNYPRCDAYVGVHPGTRIPKGTLADQELRKKRMLAHQIFDQIWLRGILSRPTPITGWRTSSASPMSRHTSGCSGTICVTR